MRDDTDVLIDDQDVARFKAAAASCMASLAPYGVDPSTKTDVLLTESVDSGSEIGGIDRPATFSQALGALVANVLFDLFVRGIRSYDAFNVGPFRIFVGPDAIEVLDKQANTLMRFAADLIDAQIVDDRYLVDMDEYLDVLIEFAS